MAMPTQTLGTNAADNGQAPWMVRLPAWLQGRLAVRELGTWDLPLLGCLRV